MIGKGAIDYDESMWITFQCPESNMNDYTYSVSSGHREACSKISNRQ